MATSLSYHRRGLERAILRGAFHGYVVEVKEAVNVLTTHFGENPHDGKQLLDFFPDNESSLVVPEKYVSHSPLMIACEEDQDEIIHFLLSEGASVALKNKHGLTALHIVCNKGRKGIVCKLVAKARTQKNFCFKRNVASDYEVAMSAKGRDVWTPLLYVVKEGHVDLLKECFAEEKCHDSTRKKQNVLHIAAKYQRVRCLEHLMSLASITAEMQLASDKNQWNILHHACAGGDAEMIQWLVEQIPDLQKREVLNQQSTSGCTPLLIACEYQKVDVVQCLLELANIDVSVCAGQEPVGDSDDSRIVIGKTALHIAAIHDSKEIAEMLIKSGCPLNVQDAEGNTALHIAYKKSSLNVRHVLRNSPGGNELEKLKNFEKPPKLPHEVIREDIIPLEILKKGKVAVQIYRKALREGKQKIPRCNLLILGEERNGKTSLYRRLVGLKFNPKQDPTRGIDNNTIEFVDTRDIASDTWEEKTSDDQKKQSEHLVALGVVQQVKKELPVHHQVPRKDTTYSTKKLGDDIRRIKQALDDLKHRSQRSQRHEFQFKPNYHPGLQEGIPTAVSVSSQPVTIQSHASFQPLKLDAGAMASVIKRAKDDADKQEHNSPIHVETQKVPHQVTSEDVSSFSAPRQAEKAPKPKHVPHPAGERTKKKISSNHIQLTRGHSKTINMLMKDSVDKCKELALTYNALDFAGQREYHPMHHCFITRRAIYLVVFDLQVMIRYIREKQQATKNPVEQIRYWLHSIHAHVFPPNEDDHMRRVCLVGTHKCPTVEETITEEEFELINNELKVLEDDERCISHLHYTTDSERMFVAVENSKDKKEEREVSGVLQLQGELKDISNHLSFLKEDHPIIWLNFEAKLVETCNARRQDNLSVVVLLEEVLAIASQQGIEEESSQRLALEFFHDTGKIVCLERLPALFLPCQEDKIMLRNLVILDPEWLIRVMKVIMELSRKSSGDRKLIIDLMNTGVASEKLLREKWNGIYSESESDIISFKKLCLMLQAYCLIFPLKQSKANGETEEQSSPDSKVESAALFLIPSMLPDRTEDPIDCSVPWVDFYFDFEKFLPETIYHRLICLMLANAEDHCREEAKFSKLWSCFYDVNGSHWRFEFQCNEHKLKVSVGTSDEKKRCDDFFKIHAYLENICDDSHLQGLKYHGGPEAECGCKDSNSKHIMRVLKFVEYNCKKKIRKKDKEYKCRKCLQTYKLDEVLEKQVKPPPEAKEIIEDDNSDTNDANVTTQPVIEAQLLCGKVSQSQLTVLKYKDKNQTSQRVRIIESAKHKWKDITSLICEDANKILALEKHYTDPGDCCRQVFMDCFINSKPEGYSHDWSGLIELLIDVDLKVLAEQVQVAISLQ